MNSQHRASPTEQFSVVTSRLLGRARTLQRAYLLRGLMLALVLMATGVVVRPASALSRDDISAALRSTVQVIVPDNDFEMFSLGSGTVMNESGLILTNEHVVAGESRNGYMNDEALAFIAVPPADLRGEAVIKYFGVVAKSDADIDLALVQILGLVDDPEAPLPENLGLPAIPQGNSENLVIGDEIHMFGYPGVGGNTPTYSRGIVSGFLDENRDGVEEWIKTDATLAHGNSGGLSTDDQGQFVGVPTAGNSDEAGTIGLVRDGNMALDFVNSYFPNPQGTGAQVTNVRFAEVINRRGEAVNPATEFDSGITDIYAVFDYSGFADGGDFSYVWYSEGREILRDAFAWDGGESGTSWVSVFHPDGLPPGLFELELSVQGEVFQTGSFTVQEGGGPVNDEVSVVGVVIDRNNTRKTISGAFIVFLKPEFTIQEWVDEDFVDTMVHGVANSNRDGEWQLDNTVVPGEFYSVVVVHDDYQAVAVDAWQIPPDTADPSAVIKQIIRFTGGAWRITSSAKEPGPAPASQL